MKVSKKQAKNLAAGHSKFGAVFPKAPPVGSGVRAQVAKKPVKKGKR